MYLFASKKCCHSADLIKLCESKNIKINVTNVEDMDTIPDFITGTPIIAVGEEGFCGDAAFQWVEKWAEQGKQRTVRPSEPATLGTPMNQLGFDPTSIIREAESDPRLTMSLEEAMRMTRK